MRRLDTESANARIINDVENEGAAPIITSSANLRGLASDLGRWADLIRAVVANPCKEGTTKLLELASHLDHMSKETTEHLEDCEESWDMKCQAEELRGEQN